ncbi:MAG: endonuclease domain-containing protein [Planctomycetota bacterium]|nr:endonuclease domain-containing protein [Planctomycetota bacterium]
MNWLNRLDFARFQRRTANAYENRLWQLLRNRQLWQAKFRRQHPLGMYKADFYCPGARLVVEIDGTEHFADTGQKLDQVRDAWMQALGLLTPAHGQRDGPFPLRANFPRCFRNCCVHQTSCRCLFATRERSKTRYLGYGK